MFDSFIMTKGEHDDSMTTLQNVAYNSFKGEYLRTSTLQSFVTLGNLLTATKNDTPMVGAAVGPPGIGKSVSQLYYEEFLVRQGGSARAISLCVLPGLTPTRLIGQLFGALGEPLPAKRSASRLADIAGALRLHERPLVMLDEADRLSNYCLDLLCMLFDRAECPCLLVGLPSLLQRCRKHAQLWSRMGACLQLPPLSFDEVLHRVFPALDIAGWEFDPVREADILLAEQLWEAVSPSLRRLRAVLGIASTLAHVHHEPRITSSCVQESLRWHLPDLDRPGRHEGRMKRGQKFRRERLRSLEPREHSGVTEHEGAEKCKLF